MKTLIYQYTIVKNGLTTTKNNKEIMKKEYYFHCNTEYTYKCSVTLIKHNGELVEHFVLEGYKYELNREFIKYGEVEFERTTHFAQIITKEYVVMINFNIN